MATSASRDQAVASSVSDPLSDSLSDRLSEPPADAVGPPDADLIRQRDEAYQRMLEAIDALRGAQAEQAAAKARVAELEHQVHVYVAENEHLHSLVGRDDGLRRRLGAFARTVGEATAAITPGRTPDAG